jgi:NADPH2:quinone reductase
MKNTRVVIAGHGGPEVLKVIEEDLPAPRSGEVRRRVLAIGVAFADVLMRYGMYPNTPPLPFSPGYDVAGVIDDLGEGVSGFAPGDTVAALIMLGGYSSMSVFRPANSRAYLPASIPPKPSASS